MNRPVKARDQTVPDVPPYSGDWEDLTAWMERMRARWDLQERNGRATSGDRKRAEKRADRLEELARLIKDDGDFPPIDRLTEFRLVFDDDGECLGTEEVT